MTSDSNFVGAYGAPAVFYLRPNLANAAAGPIAQCPDIISASAPVADPQAAFGSEASWNTAYHAAAPAGLPDYVYVRGCNGGGAAITPQVNLFAAPAQLIPWPTGWKSGVLATACSGDVAMMGVTEPGAIGVTTAPFVWTPTDLAKPGRFYGFYAWATDSAAPAAVPSASTFADMAVLLAQQHGLGVSQVATLLPDAGSWIVRVGLSVPTTATDDTQISVTIGSSGMNGAKVGLIADTFTSEMTSVLMPPTVVNNGGVVGINMKLQPGYDGVLTLQVWAGAIPPSDGAALAVTAAYKVPAAFAAEFAERGALSSAAVHLAAAAGLSPDAKIGPTPMAVLGGFTALFTATAP